MKIKLFGLLLCVMPLASVAQPKEADIVGYFNESLAQNWTAVDVKFRVFEGAAGTGRVAVKLSAQSNTTRFKKGNIQDLYKDLRAYWERTLPYIKPQFTERQAQIYKDMAYSEADYRRKEVRSIWRTIMTPGSHTVVFTADLNYREQIDHVTFTGKFDPSESAHDLLREGVNQNNVQRRDQLTLFTMVPWMSDIQVTIDQHEADIDDFKSHMESKLRQFFSKPLQLERRVRGKKKLITPIKIFTCGDVTFTEDALTGPLTVSWRAECVYEKDREFIASGFFSLARKAASTIFLSVGRKREYVGAKWIYWDGRRGIFSSDRALYNFKYYRDKGWYQRPKREQSAGFPAPNEDVLIRPTP